MLFLFQISLLEHKKKLVHLFLKWCLPGFYQFCSSRHCIHNGICDLLIEAEGLIAEQGIHILSSGCGSPRVARIGDKNLRVVTQGQKARVTFHDILVGF